MLPLRIDPTKDKGRSFQGMLLSYVTADTLWESGSGDTKRPVWAMVAATEGEAVPLYANLRLGKRGSTGPDSYARRKPDGVEFLKSAGYSWAIQRHSEAQVATIYLPDLFRVDPGMVDPHGINFVVLLPASQPDAAALQALDHLTALGALPEGEDPVQMIQLCQAASVFCTYLDRRTRAPLVPDSRFHAQVLFACLTEGLASIPHTRSSHYNRVWGEASGFGFRAHGLQDVGISAAVACKAKHEQLEAVLAEQADLFFRRANGAC